MKIISIFVSLLFIISSSIVLADPCGCCQCWRYYDYTYTDTWGDDYGYIDNINYPYNYALPQNRCFNRCPCRWWGSISVEYIYPEATSECVPES